MNLRAAFLEVASDALGSLAVIVAAVVVATTGFVRADAVAALVVAGLIVPRALVLMREATQVLLEFAPSGVEVEELARHLERLDHVVDVHDLHASSIGTGMPVLTAHLVVREACFTQGHVAGVLEQARACVAAHFDVAFEHVTFQVEPEEFCVLDQRVLCGAASA